CRLGAIPARLRGSAERGEVRFIAPRRQRDRDWFAHALAIEDADPQGAREGYRRAIDQDATCSGAYANLGRLLHAAGHLEEAQAIYEMGLARCAADATLLFNL